MIKYLIALALLNSSFTIGYEGERHDRARENIQRDNLRRDNLQRDILRQETKSDSGVPQGQPSAPPPKNQLMFHLPN